MPLGAPMTRLTPVVSAATPDNALNPGFRAQMTSMPSLKAMAIASLIFIAGAVVTEGFLEVLRPQTTIRNVRVVADAHLYGGAGDDIIGALVGSNQGDIVASHATGGTVNGGAGSDIGRRSGGL